MAPPPPFVNLGSDNGKDGSRSGLSTRAASPVSSTFHDEALDADERDNLVSPQDAGRAAKGSDGRDPQAGASAQGKSRPAAWGHERVVRVPNETARWVFTNQPQAEDTITMQARRPPVPRSFFSNAPG